MPLTAQLKRDTGNTITLPLLCVAQSKTKSVHTQIFKKCQLFKNFPNLIDENQYDEESALWQPGVGAGMKVWPRDAGQRFA